MWGRHDFSWLLISVVQTLSVSLSKTDGPQYLSLLLSSLTHSLPVSLSSKWIMHWLTLAVLETLCSYQQYTLPSKHVFINVCLWVFLLDTSVFEKVYHKTENLTFLCVCPCVCWQESELQHVQQEKARLNLHLFNDTQKAAKYEQVSSLSHCGLRLDSKPSPSTHSHMHNGIVIRSRYHLFPGGEHTNGVFATWVEVEDCSS